MATARLGAPAGALELKTFVPARDFDLSKRFYRAIGFHEDWTNGEIAFFKNGATCFLLRFEVDAGYAMGLQLQLIVDSVDDWNAHVRAAIGQFGLSVDPPTERPWGARDFVLTDPSGVRWRVTQAGRNA